MKTLKPIHVNFSKEMLVLTYRVSGQRFQFPVTSVDDAVEQFSAHRDNRNPALVYGGFGSRELEAVPTVFDGANDVVAHINYNGTIAWSRKEVA